MRFLVLPLVAAVLLAHGVWSSPAAKDSRSSSSSSSDQRQGHAVDAFKNAGKKTGLEIWRVENFTPVPVPTKEYGKFYSGDSYIVLETRENNGKKSYDIYFWLGKETTQDESGAAAIFAVELDDTLGGSPIQHREVQDHESKKFLDNFKNGVRYLDGGVSSGFRHTVTNGPTEKKLYLIKGNRNVRVKQVYADISSMNKGDCFILDSGNGDILVYVGPNAKRTEKIKANEAANWIRDQDHHGRAKVTILDEFNTPTEMAKFFQILGSGSADKVPEEAVGGNDEEFETKLDNTVALYKVSDATGSLKTEKLTQKPLSQRELNTGDSFILNAGDSGIYVWVGRRSTKEEKAQALKNGEKYLADNKYPRWTKMTRVIESAEPAAFKAYFGDWRN